MGNNKVVSQAAGILIKNAEGLYLIQDHVKHNFLTCPLGGVDDGEAPIVAARRELWEELDITNAELTLMGWEHVDLPSGRTAHSLYLLEGYSGKIINKEPHKHRSLTWMSKEEIYQTKRPLSKMLELALKMDNMVKDTHL